MTEVLYLRPDPLKMRKSWRERRRADPSVELFPVCGYLVRYVRDANGEERKVRVRKLSVYEVERAERWCDKRDIYNIEVLFSDGSIGRPFRFCEPFPE